MNKQKRTTIIRIGLLVGTIISLFFVPWILVKAWIMPLPSTIQQQLNDATDLGFDGILVYVDVAGKPAEFYAAGWHNRAEKIPADPKALFKIASITKLYQAVALAKMVHSGKLDLDKTVVDFLPEWKGKIANADKATLRMLVHHRSGIPNFTATDGFWVNPPQDAHETLERINGLLADFEPNAEYAYCNTNFLLLSEIMSKVLGTSVFQFITTEILEPLALQNTYESIRTIDMQRLMSGYYAGVEEDIKTANYGSMVATAEDVGIFIRALNDGSVFQSGENEVYKDLYVYNHTGLIPGYQSIAEYHQELDAVVVQFVNTTNFDGYEWNLGEIVYKRVVAIVANNSN